MLSREQRELVRVLERFPAFSGCDEDDLAALARSGRVTSLPARWTFIHEGTPADAVYVLLDGSARVCLAGVERAVVEPGAVIGEMALLSRRLRAASIVAATRVEALRVEYPLVIALLEARPRLRAVLGAAFQEHRAADGNLPVGASGAAPGGT